MDVEAVFPYEPQHEDELKLGVGQIIKNVEQLERGWLRGELNGVTGVFPDNFVKVISHNKSKDPSEDSPESSADVDIGKRDVDGRRCRVVFSYTPQHEDELTLCEGDILVVLQEVEEGWWKGLLHEQVGMFPSNFVEMFSETEDSLSSSTLEMRNNEINTVSERKGVVGVGYGVTQADLTKELKAKEQRREVKQDASPTHQLEPSPSSAFKPILKGPDTGIHTSESAEKVHHDAGHDKQPSKMRENTYKKDKIILTVGTDKCKQNGLSADSIDVDKEVISAVPTVPPPQLPPKPVRELAKVIYPYNAEHGDELDLKEGDVINILCKDLEDKGWWKGELNGRIGVFPDNFVEIIISDEMPKPPRPEKPSAIVGNACPKTASTANTTIPKKDKEHTPPPLPGKKVMPPPPPTEKKPHPSAAQLENGKAEVLVNGDDVSLTLDRESNLTHYTYDRPKGPAKRRPPSHVFMENKKGQSDKADSSSPYADVQAIDEVDSEPHIGERTESGREPAKGLVDLGLSPSGAKMGGMPGAPPSGTAEGEKAPWLRELKENQKRKKVFGRLSMGESELAAIQSTPTVPSIAPKPTSKPSIFPAAPCTSSPPSTPTDGTKQQDARQPADHAAPPLSGAGKSAAPKAWPPAPTPAPSQNVKAPKVGGNGLTPGCQSVVAHSAHSGESKSHPGPRGVQPNPVDHDADKVPSSRNSDTEEMKLLKELSLKVSGLELRLNQAQLEHSRQLKLLMNELDEERKERACMEVEIQRLKKLVSAYAHV